MKKISEYRGEVRNALYHHSILLLHGHNLKTNLVQIWLKVKQWQQSHTFNVPLISSK